MLGERLYELRRKEGLSQEQLAEKIGVSRQTISKWEGNLSMPELPKLIALAECYGISLDELTGYGEQTPTPISPRGADKPDDSAMIRRVAGLALCVLGLLCLSVMVVILFVNPQIMESFGGSFAITIDGSGTVYGLCILAVVVGVYLIVRKP